MKPFATDLVKGLQTQTQFLDLKQQPLVIRACILDPRFKGKGLARGEFEKEKQAFNLELQLEGTAVIETSTSAEEEDEYNDMELDIMYNCLNEEGGQDDIIHSTASSGLSEGEKELQQFLGEGCIAKQKCPLKWWKDNGRFYPRLQAEVRKF